MKCGSIVHPHRNLAPRWIRPARDARFQVVARAGPAARRIGRRSVPAVCWLLTSRRWVMRLASSRSSVPSRLPPIVNDKHDDTYMEKVRCVICDLCECSRCYGILKVKLATSSPELRGPPGQLLRREKVFLWVLV